MPTASLPRASLDTAHAQWDGTTLTLTTGRLERRWQLVPGGLATVGLRRDDGPELITAAATQPDWRLPGGLPMTDAELIAVAITTGDDDGFTAEHVRAEVSLRYPAAKVALRLELWAWPGVAAIRSALHLRALDGYVAPDADAAVTAERLAIETLDAAARAAGYYTETQQRNDLSTPILRAETIPADGSCDWASIAAVERAIDGSAQGVALVKESYKCVNQAGHDTGAFQLGADGLRATGWGLLASEVLEDRERQAWAHWTLAYDAARADSLDRAVRAAYGARFPHDPARDEYVLSNTWGSTDGSRDARDAAREANVLRELDAAVEVGVDAVQIDDGWQVSFGAGGWHPEEDHDGWKPHPAPYPQGWGPVRARAAELGVGLGLWAAGMPISLQDLRYNREHGGFRYYKLDFMVLSDHQRIEDVRAKARAFVAGSDHAVRINWDVTELAPRVGYFSMREFGCLYLANRKPCKPESTLYKPHTMLRDAWELARFQRLQDIQITVQNPERVMRAGSDAWLHPQGYCLAIALFATPVLFQQLQLLSPAARRELRALLDAYKPHRSAIYAGDVEPIGEAPSNAGHPGLRCRCSDQGGYLLCFREIGSGDAAWSATIPELADAELELEDLVGGGTTTQVVGADGIVRVDIPDTPDFRFLRYAVR